jgi:hypothetical protein
MSWPCGQNIRCKHLFWFSLQSGCGGPKKFYSFHLRVQKIKAFFFLILSTIFMNSLFSFHVFFLSSYYLFFVLGRDKTVACFSLNRTCLLHGDFLKVQFFHLDQCQLVSYKNNSYVRSVSICQDWVFSFWVITNQRGLLLIKEKNVKVISLPPSPPPHTHTHTHKN